MLKFSPSEIISCVARTQVRRGSRKASARVRLAYVLFAPKAVQVGRMAMIGAKHVAAPHPEGTRTSSMCVAHENQTIIEPWLY
ncbi:MAG: hypothetical protein QOI13_392 [Paraburkholderia sp.]|nr:hypothetical protein [Paraburkholderia sp.]